jgi:GDP-L-fucose synthase
MGDLDEGGKRVVITGAAGFLGSFVVERLRGMDWCGEALFPRGREHDLWQKETLVRIYEDIRPGMVVSS